MQDAPDIEIPKVEHIPDESSENWVVEFTNYLLTRLLCHSAGELHADLRADEGRWHVRGWTHQVLGPDEVVAQTPDKGRFRAVLAHFAVRILSQDICGGYAQRGLTQGQRSHWCVFYMANDSWRGYWLRVFVKGGERPQ